MQRRRFATKAVNRAELARASAAMLGAISGIR